MYPVLFRYGTFEITSFGAMMAVAALVALWILRREVTRSGLPAGIADAGVFGIIGGLIGAKLLWTFEHFGEQAWLSLLFSRGGLSWYGGFIGGVGVGLGYVAAKGWPIMATLAASTPALAFGHMLGRIGCFLVGDDYGRPTDLPWGIAFPKGLPPTSVPVHPTQLYEAVGLAVLGVLLLRWRRDRVADLVVFGRYLLLAGLLRFTIEFVRVDVRVALGLSVAHWVSLVVALAGAAVLARAGRSTGPA